MTPMASTLDNLTQLLDPDLSDVVKALRHRYCERQYYTGLGDAIIAVNPNKTNVQVIPENSPQVGQQYSKRKPPKSQLPPHVYSLTHQVYKGLTNATSTVPRSILVAGASGSGKTEVCQMVLAQFFRESHVSRSDPLPRLLMKGMWLLSRLTSVKDIKNSNSSLSSQVVTLYFGRDGTLKTAQFSSYLFNSRHVIPHVVGRDLPNCLYDVTAGLRDNRSGTPVLDRLGVRHNEMINAVLPRMNRADSFHHKEKWMELVDTLEHLGVGNGLNSGSGDQDGAQGVVGVLVAIVMLVSLRFDGDPHTHRPSGADVELMNIAASALGAPPGAVEHVIMSEVPKFVYAPDKSPAHLARNQLVHELYARLVKWVEADLNEAMPPVEEGYLSVRVVDLPTFDDRPSGTLGTLCQNIAAERIQTFLNEVTFLQQKDVLREEGMAAPQVKRQPCEDLTELGLAIPRGLLYELAVQGQNSGITDIALVASLDKKFGNQKNIYTGSKKMGKSVFALTHSHFQVAYTVTPGFRFDNLIVPNLESQKLLATSSNSVVREMYTVTLDQSIEEEADKHFLFTTFTRVELNRLLSQVYGTIPHLIRCVSLTRYSEPLQNADITCQLRAASIPDVIRQKKFNFTHSFTLSDFISRYSCMSPHRAALPQENRERCLAVLRNTNILDKGALITTRYVLLLYWQKERLDTLVNSYLWKVKLVQACVRGHQTRQKVRERYGPRLKALRRLNNGRLEKSPAEEEQDQIYEHLVDKTMMKITDLSARVWAKVVVLERGRQLAKVYASELSLLVTGSAESFDDIEFGLGRYCGNVFSQETSWLIGQLRQGIELKRDSDGTLLARRLSQLPVTVRKSTEGYLSADLVRNRGVLPLGTFVKILDMTEFQSLIRLTMKKGTFTQESLRSLCVVGLEIGRCSHSISSTPLCLAVVSIAALRLLMDKKEINSVSLMTSRLAMERSDEKDLQTMLQADAKARRQRQQWSRSDHRPQLKMKEENSRKIREQLRQRGEAISDHMKYSWEEDRTLNPSINMDQLYEKMRRGSLEDSVYSEPRNHQWAKVDVTLRQVSREMSTTD
ncbi:myosin-IIIb [Aplysia californica]|uniref:Myosin-IIIb n=1 Tax=Aplysia californica TaxID=6500 RepID=A0ABM0K228_APLCA|nr:myosin-IIIb [Aplysia californica]